MTHQVTTELSDNTFGALEIEAAKQHKTLPEMVSSICDMFEQHIFEQEEGGTLFIDSVDVELHDAISDKKMTSADIVAKYGKEPS